MEEGEGLVSRLEEGEGLVSRLPIRARRSFTDLHVLPLGGGVWARDY